MSIRPARRRRRALRPAPARARPDPGRRRRGGRRATCSTRRRSPGCCATPTGRVAGVVGRTRAGPASTSPPGVTRGRGRHPVERRRAGRCRDHVAGPGRERGALPLRRGPAGGRLRVGVRRRRRRRPDPHQRRASCVFVATTPTGCAPAPPGVERAFADLLVRGRSRPPSTGCRRPAGRPVHGWAGVPGFVRESGGPGLGAGRRRGLLQGPDHHARHDRRAARRRAARRAVLAALGGAVPGAGGAGALPADPRRLSRRLCDATEAVAAYDWDAPRQPLPAPEVSSAMSDEVEHLESLRRRTRASSAERAR